MIELFFFKTGAFLHFGYNKGDVSATQFTVSFTDEQICEFSLIVIHKKVLEFEVVKSVSDFVIETFYLCF